MIVGDRKDFKRDQIPWIFKYMRTIQITKNGNDHKLNQIAEALQEVA